MSASSEVRARLDHPVVDIDGHAIEYFPVLAGFLEQQGVDLASPSLRRLLPGAFGPEADWYALSPEERARTRTARPPWWGSPARNTRDLATALFPALLYERLDELGIDVSVIYPSIGLVFLHFEDERERRGACRALNRCNAEMFAPFADRLVPVAAIPMHTPEEAIDELDDAVGARVQGGAARGLRAAAGRRARRAAPRRGALGPVDRQVRHRQRVRLRPGVGEVPRARRRRWRSTPARSAGGSRRVDLELHVQPRRPRSPRASTRCASRCSSAASPAASPSSTSRSSRAAWPGRRRSTPTSSATGRSATASALRRARPAPHRPGPVRRAASASTATTGGPQASTRAMPTARTGGPGDARRVRGAWHRAARGHPRPVRRQLLLRLRGRRPAHDRRVQHRGEPVRRPAASDVRLRHRALGRARHDRGRSRRRGRWSSTGSSPRTTSVTSCS